MNVWEIKESNKFCISGIEFKDLNLGFPPVYSSMNHIEMYTCIFKDKIWDSVFTFGINRSMESL